MEINKKILKIIKNTKKNKNVAQINWNKSKNKLKIKKSPKINEYKLKNKIK